MEVFSVDTFLGSSSKGNRAGVSLISAPIDDKNLQSIAHQFNASETAFILKQKESYSLRWFTPTVEVDLCGHGTMAAAHWLWSNNNSNTTDTINFKTRSGNISCTRLPGGLVEIELPEFTIMRTEPEKGLLEAFGLESALSVGRCDNYTLIEVKNQNIIESLSVNFNALIRLNTKGVFVTSISNSSEFDFVSRCFFPKEGIPEDPVTGSAHCYLGPYWRNKLLKQKLKAKQISSQGGELHIRFNNSKVLIAGKCNTRKETSRY